MAANGRWCGRPSQAVGDTSSSLLPSQPRASQSVPPAGRKTGCRSGRHWAGRAAARCLAWRTGPLNGSPAAIQLSEQLVVQREFIELKLPVRRMRERVCSRVPLPWDPEEHVIDVVLHAEIQDLYCKCLQGGHAGTARGCCNVGAALRIVCNDSPPGRTRTRAGLSRPVRDRLSAMRGAKPLSRAEALGGSNSLRQCRLESAQRLPA